MLKKRPRNNRKIILLVSETRDSGSEGRVRETLIDAQLSNVLVYTVDITQLAVRLTEKPTPPRPNPIDVTAHPRSDGPAEHAHHGRSELWPRSGAVRAAARRRSTETRSGSSSTARPRSSRKAPAAKSISFVKQKGPRRCRAAHQPGDPQPVPDQLQPEQSGRARVPRA